MATKVVLFENKVKIRFIKAIQYVFANSTEMLQKLNDERCPTPYNQAMQIYETFDPNPFRVNAYRTDKALFLHILPQSWEKYFRQLRLVAIVYGCPIFFMFFVMLYNARFSDAAGLLVFGISMITALAFAFYLLTQEQLLICIDQNTIHKTSWFFGKGSYSILIRPDKIFFLMRDRKWNIVAQNGAISLGIRDHELQWLRDIVAQFENEVPVLAAETESKTVSVSDWAKAESGRRVLENMEYQGRKLRKIPNPTEQYLSNNITKKKLADELPGTLRVRCSYCNSLLPTDYVLTDTALAQCPCCGFLFEIDDLKRYPPPRHSSIKLQTEENILKLHQSPQIFNHPFFYLALFFVIINIDLVLAAFYIQIRQINPEATLQEIGVLSQSGNLTFWAFMIVIANLFCFLLFLWSIFVHRFVEFRLHEVYFCIRWLCFWRSWTAPRSQLGVSRSTFFSRTLNIGFQIPYGKKSFPIGAKQFEIPWIVGEINYWLLTHLPDELPISEDFPLFENENTIAPSFSKEPNHSAIGGVGEYNSNKEIRWHCCNCKHQFLTEELDFPNRTAFCPKCCEKFDLLQLQRYVVEPTPVKPEFPQFSVEKSEKEQRIELSTTPINVSTKIMYVIGFTFFGVSLVVMSPPLIKFLVILINLNRLDITDYLHLVPMILPFSLVIGMPFYFLCLLYDEYRQNFTSWATRFSDGYFELTRRYKNYSETIRIETERIARFRRGRAEKNLSEFIKNFPIFNHFPSTLESRGHVRNEIILTDGTTIYLPILREPKNNHGWNNWLVNTWNEQLYQHR
jgi:hypothetical protein